MNRTRGEQSAEREETTHSHQTKDAMSDPVPRLPRRAGAKQSIDWLKLFHEHEAGKSCVAVADEYRAGGRLLKADTLQKRYKRWKRAKDRGDEGEMSKAEGKETTKGQYSMAFTPEEEKELADKMIAEKGEAALLD